MPGRIFGIRPSVALSTLALLCASPGAIADGPDSLPPEPQPAVTWDGDLATIEWTEPLRDEKAADGEVPFSILTGPYLGWLTPDSAVIGWEVVAEKKLTERPYASLSGNYVLDRMQFRSAKLNDLKPDTVYRYRLRSPGDGFRLKSPEFEFRTLPPPDSKVVRFALIGDTQRHAAAPWTDINQRLYADIIEWDPPLVLHVGDIVYDSWGASINGRKGWFRVMNLMRPLRARAFLAPGLGNHDIHPDRAIWPPSYFRDIPVKTNAAGSSRPPFYYSFDVGHVHFVALCTEVGAGRDFDRTRRLYDSFTYDEQLAWLDENLKSTRAVWKVVHFHQPLHTTGGYPAPQVIREDFGRLFDKHGVQLVLSGHDHSYQRTWRIDNATRERADDGSVQVVSGGASNLFPSRGPQTWNVLHTKVHHYCRVTIDGDEARIETIRDSGEALESWKLPLVGQPETIVKYVPRGDDETDGRKINE
ncbi:MAG: metallophosphoesterase family protein [Planctomycetaceae bacterium]